MPEIAAQAPRKLDLWGAALGLETFVTSAKLVE